MVGITPVFISGTNNNRLQSERKADWTAAYTPCIIDAIIVQQHLKTLIIIMLLCASKKVRNIWRKTSKGKPRVSLFSVATLNMFPRRKKYVITLIGTNDIKLCYIQVKNARNALVTRLVQFAISFNALKTSKVQLQSFFFFFVFSFFSFLHKYYSEK